MDPIIPLLVLLVLLAIIVPAGRRAAPNGVLDVFGSGFLPYRPDLGWPAGVQEEEPHAWTFRPAGAGQAESTGTSDDDDGDADNTPTIIELAAGSHSTDQEVHFVVARPVRSPGSRRRDD